MRYAAGAVVFFLVLMLQGSLSFFQIAPNLTVLLACYAGLRGRELKGMLTGSLIGIIEDSLSGAFLGPHLLSKSLIGYLSSFIYNRFFIWTPYLGILSIAILTLIDSSFVFILRSIFDKPPAGLGTASFVIVMQSLINAPLGVFLKPSALQESA
ncbi:MAG: rod shape-determining protein MreD [Nitrospirota bacterium]